MFALSKPNCRPHGTHGSVAGEVLASLETSRLNGWTANASHRQRLCKLAERLARVQALGGEYARVRFSPEIESQISQMSVVTEG